HRHVERQRVAGTGTVAVGRHHQDIVAGGAQPLGEVPDPRRVDTVVVADQNSHGLPWQRPAGAWLEVEMDAPRPRRGRCRAAPGGRDWRAAMIADPATPGRPGSG